MAVDLLSHTIFCCSVYVLFWFITQLISITRLKNEKARTELMVLRSQVSPHFFFNMLNSLYGWVAKDPKKKQELILKLSDMMRYSIILSRMTALLKIERRFNGILIRPENQIVKDLAPFLAYNTFENTKSALSGSIVGITILKLDFDRTYFFK